MNARAANAVRERLRDAWRRGASGLWFPLHERLKGHDTVRRLRELETTQWWEAARIEALRAQRLRGLLQDAAASVPYFRDLARAGGFDWRAVREVADLERLPFMTKETIRAHVGRLRSEAAKRLHRSNTGGSTGEPMVFYLGSERVSHDVAAKWRATRWWGVDIGDPEIVLWGSPVELGAQDRVRALRDRLLRSRLLPAFRMAEADLETYARTIRRLRPRMLFGYPSALHRLAAFAAAREIPLDGAGVRVVFTTGERLYDEQRATIAAVFGAPVANGYGGRDAGFIAHECPAGGMHVSAEDIIVEVVGPDGRTLPAGRPGEIVVTHLATRAFPFIRYRTGDIGTLDPHPCTCGRGLPLLRDVQGRSTDFVVAEDGTVMHGLALIYVIREIRGVRAFKIVQESRSAIEVLIEPGPDFADGARETIVAGLRKRLGSGVDVRVRTVREIPAEASGKFRYVVSHAPEAAR